MLINVIKQNREVHLFTALCVLSIKALLPLCILSSPTCPHPLNAAAAALISVPADACRCVCTVEP